MLCDGSILDSVANPEYANLYAVIGTTWGGSSATSFNVPDLVTNNRYLRQAGGSLNIGDVQSQALQSHNAEIISKNHTGSAWREETVVMYDSNTLWTGVAVGWERQTTSDANGGENLLAKYIGTETRPHSAVVNYIIKI